MNTEESPTARRVNDLLATLERMEKDGSSAFVRLKYLAEHGPQIPGELDFDLNALLERIEGLERIAASVDEFKAAWGASPLDDETRTAGLRLVEYLAQLVEERRSADGHSEIEMLSRIWGPYPDIRAWFPELTAWSGPVRRPAPAPAPDPDYVAYQRLLSKRVELEMEAEEGTERLVMETERDASTEIHVEEVRARESVPEPEAKVAAAEPSPEVPAEKTEAQVSFPPTPPEPPVHGSFSVPDALGIRAWTDSLNEMTATNWTFESAEHRARAITVRWRGLLPPHDARLEMQHQADGKVLVMLRVLGAENRVERATTTLELDALAALHADPLPFVKTLREG